MQKRNALSRTLLAFTLFALLCAGPFAPPMEHVQAKPPMAADKVSVVISEFRTRGPGGADDEFVEIYNATGNSVTLTNWLLKRSAGCGAVASTPLATINAVLAPGQYYLVGKSPEYTGSTSLDLPYSSSTPVADDGGIALLDNLGNIIDQVGLCSDTVYKEGTSLSPLSGTSNQSYERKNGGSAGNCRDTDNNSTDFILNSSSSNPQNSFTSPLSCLVVTNVTSTTADGVYLDTSGTAIDVQVTFSNSVNVTGSPTLLIETGTTDRAAIFSSGNGTNTLTFTYTITPGDTSGDLDYVSANALSLNGGSITGAIGDATLILPIPGQTGSLSDNKDITIDIAGSPSILSFRRQNPATTPTNNDSLTFRVTFSEAVDNVTMDDFIVTGPVGASIIVSSVGGGSIYDVTVSGGDLGSLNSAVGLDLRIIPLPDIVDVGGNPLSAMEPVLDETYIVDNVGPNIVSINQAPGQVDPASNTPINFDVVFSEAINTSTFVPADITQNGTALGVAWSIINSGNNINFTLSAIASGNGTLNPSISGNRVEDLAGNGNIAFTSGCANPEPNNCVTLADNTPPAVTINQASGQPDPTSTLPINFAVLFSEPINPSVFTTSDITQNGTATGITWSIVNSGNNRAFTLSATAVTGFGTLIPSIAANRVTDWAGNNNTASTSTDNSVNYTVNTANVRSVIINEVAWAGTTSSLTDDEWIELYNPGSTSINVTGWTLKSSGGSPSVNIVLNGTIPSKSYFLLERDNDSTVSDILADQVYTGALSNSGDVLTLRDGLNKIIDTANGNAGSWPAGSSSTYGTMERSGTSNETDSVWRTNTGVKKNGKNANNGDILGTPKNSNSLSPTPTPNKTATSSASTIGGKLVINEFLPRPGYDWNQDGSVDVFDEFIELKNIGFADINLSNWRIDDEANAGSNPFTLPSVILKPGERIVLYGLQTNILLSDGGDTVRLLSSSSQVYDSYTYKVAKAEDESVCRMPDGNGNWYEDCVPTPRFTNSREGNIPSMPDKGFESPVCQLPDTLPEAFLIAECRGYGANLWRALFWDALGWGGDKLIPANTSKWETFVE